MLNTFSIADYVERLEATQTGQFCLTVEADTARTKTLTSAEAREWYAKRFPNFPWESIVNQFETWKNDMAGKEVD